MVEDGRKYSVIANGKTLGPFVASRVINELSDAVTDAGHEWRVIELPEPGQVHGMGSKVLDGVGPGDIPSTFPV